MMLNHNELFTIIPQSDYLRMPWKNGLGETLEIAVCRNNDEVLYRVSQASVVEDGVFSDFSGLHRTLVLLSGQGMLLTHKNNEAEHSHHLKQPLAVAKFAGGDLTYAFLEDGPIEDLNIMVREGKAISNVVAKFAPDSFFMELSEFSLLNAFYVTSEGSFIIDNGGEKFSLHVKPHQTILFHKTARVDVFSGSGVVININKNMHI